MNLIRKKGQNRNERLIDPVSRRGLLFIWLLLPVFLLSFLVSGCSDNFPPEFPVPDFKLKSPNTDWQESRETIKGSPVIMYWFTSW